MNYLRTLTADSERPTKKQRAKYKTKVVGKKRFKENLYGSRASESNLNKKVYNPDSFEDRPKELEDGQNPGQNPADADENPDNVPETLGSGAKIREVPTNKPYVFSFYGKFCFFGTSGSGKVGIYKPRSHQGGGVPKNWLRYRRGVQSHQKMATWFMNGPKTTMLQRLMETRFTSFDQCDWDYVYYFSPISTKHNNSEPEDDDRFKQSMADTFATSQTKFVAKNVMDLRSGSCVSQLEV